MSAVTFYVGDSLTVTRTLPDASVDLVLTSPPFLALRSYLPADDPDKASEVGSEATPAAFIDTLLDLTEEWARVLAPHGSIVVELGDTYSGSGGAGGDYGKEGLRDGQQRFDGSAVRGRLGGTDDSVERRDDESAGVGTRFRTVGNREHRPPGHVKRGGETAGSLVAHSVPANSGPGWPLAKSLCLIPESYRWALVYGRNPFNGRETPRWRARNVVRWCRPNPPVGALGDKFRPGTSDLVVACKSDRRWFDLDAVRTESDTDDSRRDEGPQRYAPDGQPARQTFRTANPAGAPPLDWWRISTAPYAGAHYATWPPKLCELPIKAMCPAGGVVLDPFAGSGTTLMVAHGHGRNAVGIDLDRRNADLVRERLGMFVDIIEPAVDVAS